MTESNDEVITALHRENVLRAGNADNPARVVIVEWSDPERPLLPFEAYGLDWRITASGSTLKDVKRSFLDQLDVKKNGPLNRRYPSNPIGYYEAIFEGGEISDVPEFAWAGRYNVFRLAGEFRLWSLD